MSEKIKSQWTTSVSTSFINQSVRLSVAIITFLVVLIACLSMTKAQSTAAVTNVAFGWNLLGNGVNSQISVASSFGNNGNVISVWKWDSATSTWAFYSPPII